MPVGAVTATLSAPWIFLSTANSMKIPQAQPGHFCVLLCVRILDHCVLGTVCATVKRCAARASVLWVLTRDDVLQQEGFARACIACDEDITALLYELEHTLLRNTKGSA